MEVDEVRNEAVRDTGGLLRMIAELNWGVYMVWSDRVWREGHRCLEVLVMTEARNDSPSLQSEPEANCGAQAARTSSSSETLLQLALV